MKLPALKWLSQDVVRDWRDFTDFHRPSFHEISASRIFNSEVNRLNTSKEPSSIHRPILTKPSHPFPSLILPPRLKFKSLIKVPNNHAINENTLDTPLFQILSTRSQQFYSSTTLSYSHSKSTSQFPKIKGPSTCISPAPPFPPKL